MMKFKVSQSSRSLPIWWQSQDWNAGSSDSRGHGLSVDNYGLGKGKENSQMTLRDEARWEGMSDLNWS